MMRPARYNTARHDLWVARLGRLIDTDGPCGNFRLHNGRVDLRWPVGCYIAAHEDTSVRYVGKVHRRGGGFDERFRRHHQPVNDWGRVWLLPLRRDVSPFVVGAVEALLIAALRPTDNTVRPQFWPLTADEVATLNCTIHGGAGAAQ